MSVFRFPCSHAMSIQYFLIFSYLNPPSKASGIAVALFQSFSKLLIPRIQITTHAPHLLLLPVSPACIFIMYSCLFMKFFEILLDSEQLHNNIHRISRLCGMPLLRHLNGTVHIPGCCHYKNRQTVLITAVDLTFPVFQPFPVFLNARQKLRRNTPSI